MKKMLKVAFFAVAGLLACTMAQAGTDFSAGTGSSYSLSGGAMAESGTNGNGFSTQYATSSGGGYVVGGTVIGAGVGGYAVPGFAAAAGGALSGSAGYGTTATYSYSSGQTGGSGYGDSKGGVGIDYSSYGYSNLNASYGF